MIENYGILASISEIGIFAKEIAKYKSFDIVSERITAKIKNLVNVDDAVIYTIAKGKLCHRDRRYNRNIEALCEEYSALREVLRLRKPLIIPDIHNIKDESPYSDSFLSILKTDIEPRAVAIIPVYDDEDNIKLMLFLINPKNDRGKPIEFSTNIIGLAHKTVALSLPLLQRSELIKNMIFKMVKISSMKDPNETGLHVQRVGIYSAEIFHQWAVNNHMPDDYAYTFKDQIRLAAMLHDVGKAGIDEVILKKPAKLTPEEYEHIKTHCILGARLFDDDQDDVGMMSREIALHHHQKWDGTGYGEPGKLTLFGEKIPLSARIVAVADVFDALVSKRCYKPAYPFNEACRLLGEKAGSHFDPAVIDAFFAIQNTIKSISKLYREE